MQIHFKGTNYEIPPALHAHATKKINGLGKYLGKMKRNASAYVDLGRETVAHQSGRVWYADISLDANGTRFYARALEESMEAAFDEAFADVGRELRSARAKEQSLVRRGGALFKSLMQRRTQA